MGIPFASDIEMVGGAKVTGLPTPSANTDAASKGYVDGVFEGLKNKDPVVVSTQSNLNLSAPGSTIDGVTMALNDRFLARNQSTASQNGIYIWNGAAVAATRSLDANAAVELNNAIVEVIGGTDAGNAFRQSAVVATLGSDSVTWSSWGSGVPDATETTPGKIEIATQAETNTGTDDVRAITPEKLANYTGFAKTYATDIGDGAQTAYTVTHNMNNEDVTVSVYNNSTGKKTEVETEITGVNSIELTFASAPSSNAYRVVVKANDL